MALFNINPIKTNNLHNPCFFTEFFDQSFCRTLQATSLKIYVCFRRIAPKINIKRKNTVFKLGRDLSLF